MKCPRCRFVNPENTRFCGDCGTRLDLSGKKTPPERPDSDLRGDVSFTRTLETGTDELTRGTTFAGRYEIIEELGTGGMGRVYRAFDRKIGEEVALKLIRPEIAAEKRTVERFRNEIKIARKITHKNVCRMHDLNMVGGFQGKMSRHVLLAWFRDISSSACLFPENSNFHEPFYGHSTFDSARK